MNRAKKEAKLHEADARRAISVHSKKFLKLLSIQKIQMNDLKLKQSNMQRGQSSRHMGSFQSRNPTCNSSSVCFSGTILKAIDGTSSLPVLIELPNTPTKCHGESSISCVSTKRSRIRSTGKKNNLQESKVQFPGELLRLNNVILAAADEMAKFIETNHQGLQSVIICPTEPTVQPRSWILFWKSWSRKLMIWKNEFNLYQLNKPEM
ncbi:hypothetical protein QAD02_017982 [Eretmocerus hayati]|uniref:Uncharacterized protein n=1 Tax=Eretmocerus hayati TaxID=131215 RepID=A0ACC2PFH6_9HYME|nr:hypothetical protein QAD02_017982 [Eretmocerus hayati]